MPTENRSSNTEMVSVPRHTLENVLNDGSCKAEVHAAFIQARNDIKRLLTLPAEQQQGEPVVSIPEEYCLMPRRLTAENGAKALLLGEFKLNVVRECPILKSRWKAAMYAMERASSRKATRSLGIRSSSSTARL
ncbi:hypothetical protein HU735_26450 [Pseudomonas sp. BW16M2]|uniref:hypothetical protein n=1 Tax=Pseudomonas sp. BW16M2 TaxID=2745489 RepID=UPI001648248B|nr:hypothetical protein [Pseudomonas sp. BW16M2]MBC3438964.1 hypothetical protein [Pseudomonas sp. BW16M2]